jgi:hypothetical protein
LVAPHGVNPLTAARVAETALDCFAICSNQRVDPFHPRAADKQTVWPQKNSEGAKRSPHEERYFLAL